MSLSDKGVLYSVWLDGRWDEKKELAIPVHDVKQAVKELKLKLRDSEQPPQDVVDEIFGEGLI